VFNCPMVLKMWWGMKVKASPNSQPSARNYVAAGVSRIDTFQIRHKMARFLNLIPSFSTARPA
jgi:hypothetical protein